MKQLNKKPAFTIAELVIVMVFIGFLWVFAIVSISKNHENKINVYIYNTFKELQHANQNINSYLLKKYNNSNKNIDDILLETGAIGYCDAFASVINTSGTIDCVQGSKQFMVSKDEKPNIENTYDCIRTYRYNVNSGGTLSESYMPLTSQYSNDISKYAGNYQNLINPDARTGNKYYNCTKTTREIPKDSEGEAVEFNLDQRIINNAFNSANNVNFYFIATSKYVDNNYYEKNIYNYKADIYQDAICNASTVSGNNYKNLIIYNSYKEKPGYGKGYNTTKLNQRINQARFGSASSSNVGIFKAQKGVSLCGDTFADIQNKIPDLNNEDRCIAFFNLYKNYGDRDCCIFAYTNNGDRVGNYSNIGCWEAVCQAEIKCVQMPSTVGDPNTRSASEFYNKWKNYFMKYHNNNVFYKAGVSLRNVDEGQYENKEDFEGTLNTSYPNHFIYVAIDTPFKLGTYGKNVFAFEHYDSKIIPVGILANSEDSPLKFNVITRNEDSKKNIERLNDKPLNFCEAMQYTGEKFSPYCECKDNSGNIVTQYKDNIPAKCKKGFGCMARPIRPEISRFKLFSQSSSSSSVNKK